MFGRAAMVAGSAARVKNGGRILGRVICPNCEAEYREGFTRCSNCDVDLVDALPSIEIRGDLELVKIFESGNPALLSLARSLLDDAQIDYTSPSASRSFNSVVGPNMFFVRKEDEAEALALLADISEDMQFEELPDDEDDEDDDADDEEDTTTR